MPDEPDRPSLGQRARDAEQARKNRRDRMPLHEPGIPVGTGPPQWYRSMPNRSTVRWLLLVFFGIVVLAIIRSGHVHPPALATSCTKPGLALSTSSVPQNGNVRWAGTGPAHEEVVLAIGVRGFRNGTAANKLTAIPDPGRTAADVEQASALIRFDSDCRISGVFSALVPPGHYQVRLFRIRGLGSSLTTTAVASRPLDVH